MTCFEVLIAANTKVTAQDELGFVNRETGKAKCCVVELIAFQIELALKKPSFLVSLLCRVAKMGPFSKISLG